MKPLFQSEAKREAIDRKIIFYSLSFTLWKGFALSLVLKMRVFGPWKAYTSLVPRAFPSINHFLREKPWGRGWAYTEILKPTVELVFPDACFPQYLVTVIELTYKFS